MPSLSALLAIKVTTEFQKKQFLMTGTEGDSPGAGDSMEAREANPHKVVIPFSLRQIMPFPPSQGPRPLQVRPRPTSDRACASEGLLLSRMNLLLHLIVTLSQMLSVTDDDNDDDDDNDNDITGVVSEPSRRVPDLHPR